MPGSNDWFSDTPISLPEPPASTPLVDLGGFWFSQGGICHNINTAGVEDLAMQTPDFNQGSGS